MSWLNDALSEIDILNLKLLVRGMQDCEIKEFAEEHLRKRLAEGEEERVTPEQRQAFALKILEAAMKRTKELAEERSRDELRAVIIEAGTCTTLDAFRAQLPS